MATFAQAVQNDNEQNTIKPVVDLFFLAGASRGKNLESEFRKAFDAYPILTARLGLWLRDVRGGAGERQQFRNFLNFLESYSDQSREILFSLIPAIAEVGRYDDLFCFKSPEFKFRGFVQLQKALADPNTASLAAKWCPREKSAKSDVAKDFRNFLGLNSKQYRKMLSTLTNVVETSMCAKQWNDIVFAHVPSVASARYQKAFSRNAPKAYSRYRDSLVKGETKINASAVFPYDVVMSAVRGDRVVANEQWKALPDYVGEAKILPMIDVSGSMSIQAHGSSRTCMDIAISLGMYIAEKQQGKFNGLYMTFTKRPRLATLANGDLLTKFLNVKQNVGFSTNLDAAFREILNVAKTGKVHQEEMPEYLLIMSDMQFNGKAFHWNASLKAKIDAEFALYGYKTPNLIWWNIAAAQTSVPVKANVEGVGLVSGASPSVVKSILAAKNVTPADIMLEAINSPRYTRWI